MESPLVVLMQVAHALDEQGIAYVVVGSFASSMRGVYRATNDIDIIADIQSHQIDLLVEKLQTDFYIDKQAVRQAVARRRSFNAIHFESVFKVDIFIPPIGEFSQQQLARRQRERISPDSLEEIYVATAEDTVLAKFSWYRAGGEISTTQWKDVIGIIGTQGAQLDFNYLREWADRLGVRDLLEKALEETR